MRLLNYPLWMDLWKTMFSNLLVILNRAKVKMASFVNVKWLPMGSTHFLSNIADFKVKLNSLKSLMSG